MDEQQSSASAARTGAAEQVEALIAERRAVDPSFGEATSAALEAVAAVLDAHGGERCGGCRWHHDLAGWNERAGWRHCLARSYPDCTLILSREDAKCDVPGSFSPR